MEKVNATLYNIIMFIMAAVMGLCSYFIPSAAIGTGVAVLAAVVVVVLAVAVLRKADINPGGYYIFGSHKTDTIVSAVEFVLVLGLMTYLGVSGMVSPGVCSWETAMIIGFCAMLFYGIEKKRLREDMIAEIEAEQRRQMMEEEESEN